MKGNKEELGYNTGEEKISSPTEIFVIPVQCWFNGLMIPLCAE